MSYLHKPAFEQFRAESIKQGRPMLEKNVVPIQAAIVQGLDGLEELLVEKARRLPHPDGMIEISAKWFGLNSDQDDVVKFLRRGWDEAALASENCGFWVGPSDEAVLLMFAARYADDRYLTGRMLITF